MAKLYENIYIEKIQKKILNNELSTKEELLKFLNEIKHKILQDSYLQQYFQDSFIKLNEETINKMNKFLLDYYDKRKNNDLIGLNLDGVSSFEIGDKDYIKYRDKDGNIIVMDDSLDQEKFTEQFQERQNELISAQTENSEKNKITVLNDMQKDKQVIKFDSSVNVDKRELTSEERAKFATAMKISDAELDNFLVSIDENMYINRDTGEVYYVNQNNDGQLEVRRANEIESKTNTQEIKAIDDEGVKTTMLHEIPKEINYDIMSDSDLVYILETKSNSITPQQYMKIKDILQKRKDNNLEKEQNTLNKDKVYVKKLSDVGFISILLLSILASSFGIGLLLSLFIRM